MKRVIRTLCIHALTFLFVVTTPCASFAHPGRLDKNGGHNVKADGWGYPVGSYHYHKGNDRDTAYDKNGNVIPKNTSTSTSTTTSTPTPSLSKDEIKKYQQKLNEAGYNCGEPDGSVGPKTKAAINAFQTDNKLSITGAFDSDTRSALDKVKSTPAPIATTQPITVIVDGETIIFDQPPENINGRIMVPIRSVVEKMDCNVEWDDKTQTVYINKSGGTIRKTASATGNINVFVNNESIDFEDQYPVNKNGRILIPVRFVVEKLGYGVNWDDKSQTLNINKS